MSFESQDPYLEAAHKIKEKLDQVSPSFCIAKWKQVTIHLTTGRTHSCFLPPHHKIPLDELAKDPAALHNTNFKMKQRQQMLLGNRPTECSTCWMVEDLKGDHISDRFFRSSEAWAADYFEEVKTLAWNAPVLPSYVEVNFSSACQFKCVYCSAALSSSWQQEVAAHGPIKTIRGHVPLEHLRKQGLLPIPPDQHNPYVEAFWKWWPALYPNLRVFRMTGGEPLIDSNTYKVFDYALENPNPNLSLSITSNLCPTEKFFEKFLNSAKALQNAKSIKDFQLFVSFDSVDRRAEFIRWGLDFETLKKNIRRYLTELPESEIYFINTVNLLSLSSLPKYLEFVFQLRTEFSNEHQRIHFDIPRLQNPFFLNAKLATVDFFVYLEEALRLMELNQKKGESDFFGFSNAEIEKLYRLMSWIKTPEPTNKVDFGRCEFFMYIEDYQQRRKIKFAEVFPEMLSFLGECRSAVDRVKKANYDLATTFTNL